MKPGFGRLLSKVCRIQCSLHNDFLHVVADPIYYQAAVRYMGATSFGTMGMNGFINEANATTDKHKCRFDTGASSGSISRAHIPDA
jgi:hypothetical protein